MRGVCVVYKSDFRYPQLIMKKRRGRFRNGLVPFVSHCVEIFTRSAPVALPLRSNRYPNKYKEGLKSWKVCPVCDLKSERLEIFCSDVCKLFAKTFVGRGKAHYYYKVWSQNMQYHELDVDLDLVQIQFTFS